MRRLLIYVVVLNCVFLCSCQARAADDPSAFQAKQKEIRQSQVTGQETQEESFQYDQRLLDELEEEYSQDDVQEKVYDPLEPYNRFMFRVNDTLYTYFLKPVAQGYAFVVPDKLRQGIDNAFYNVRFPGRFVNDLLEARFPSAVRETGSFMVNTIFGFLGFIKVSRHVPGLQPPPVAKDTGLTLGTWGLGQGFYIVWPVFGPNTLRSSVGLIGDYFLDPLSYIDPDGWRYGLKGEEKVNMTSLHLGEYEDMKEGAVDPYIALRSAYIQHRKQLLQD